MKLMSSCISVKYRQMILLVGLTVSQSQRKTIEYCCIPQLTLSNVQAYLVINSENMTVICFIL